MDKVGRDIENLDFNTAISALMILVNEIYKQNSLSHSVLQRLTLCLAPFAPHVCEEIWVIMNEPGLCSNAPWPVVDTKLLTEDQLSMAVQVNGKKRGLIDISKDTPEDEALALAKNIPAVQNVLEGKEIRKVIYVPGRILNLIAK